MWRRTKATMTASSRYGDRNEVGYEVERHRQVGDERGDDELSAPGDAGVGEEAAEENDEVWDESGQGARLVLAAGDDEPEEEERVGAQRHSRANQDPLPDGHATSKVSPHRADAL
jgi:hypothetical protein